MEFQRSFSSRFKLSLTPLIDVVFLLVVFFMLTTTFTKHEGISLNFGQASTEAKQQSEVKHIHIIVAGNDRITLNGATIGNALFSKNIADLLAKHPNRQIALETADSASVQDMVTVMDLVQQHGGSNITFLEPQQ